MRLSYNLQKTKAVLVGISEYQQDFSPIKPAKNNVLALKDVLQDKEIFGLPEQNIITLIDTDNGEIIDTIEDIIENDDLDTFIFYYVGHGYRPKKGKLYLTATNSIGAVRKIKYSGIEYDDLKELIERAGKKRIVIIDACYSGIAAQGDNIALEEPEKEISGTYVLTSAPKDEQALFDTNGEYTFFTKELIETFKAGSNNVDDFFSLNDVYGIVEKKLRLDKKPEPQKKDNFNVNNSDFKFAKNKRYNKEALISKAEAFYDAKNYTKTIEIIEIIRKRYSVKKLDKIYDYSRNELDFTQKYSECQIAFKNSDFEHALKIASEAIIIKEDDRNVELRRVIDECKRSIEIKKKLAVEYETKIELNLKEVDSLNKDLKNIKFELDEKNKTLDKTQSNQIKLQDELQKKDSLLKTKIEENEKYNKELVDNLNSEIDTKKAEIQKLSNQVIELSTEINKKEELFNEKTKEIEKNQSEIDLLNKSILDLKSANKKIEVESRSEISKLSEIVERSKKVIEQRESAVINSQKDFELKEKELSQKLSEQTSKNKNAEIKISKLNQMTDSLKSKISKFEEQHIVEKEINENISQSLKVAESKNIEFSEKLSKLNGIEAKFNSSLNELKKLRKFKSDYSGKIHDLEEKVLELEIEVEEYSVYKTDLNKVKELENMKSLKHNDLNKMKNEVSLQEDIIRSKKTEIKNLDEKIRQKKERMTKRK